jgi:hypothetical protein
MLDVFVQLKSRLKVAQQEIRNFKSLPESEKNLWFGPLVLVSWSVIALLVGPSRPRDGIGGILDLRQYFSFIGGYWFLLLIILSATTVGVIKDKWSRYVLSALAVAHFIFYASYIPGREIYDGDTFRSLDGRISLFGGSLRAAVFFELIPLAGALMTVRLESAQWMRIRMARIVPAIRKWVKQSRGSVNQSGYSAANRAWRASRVVEAFGWINIVVGFIAGIILIILGFKGMNCDSYYDECTTDGTYVGYGFGVIFACLIQGSFFVMIGAFISSRTAVSSTSSDWKHSAP